MSRVLNVEYAHVVGGRDNCTVVGIRHELYAEDVGAMSCNNGRGKAELRGRRLGLVRVDIDAMVIGARGEQTAGRGPASNACQLKLVALENGDIYLKALTQPV